MAILYRTPKGKENLLSLIKKYFKGITEVYFASESEINDVIAKIESDKVTYDELFSIGIINIGEYVPFKCDPDIESDVPIYFGLTQRQGATIVQSILPIGNKEMQIVGEYGFVVLKEEWKPLLNPTLITDALTVSQMILLYVHSILSHLKSYSMSRIELMTDVITTLQKRYDLLDSAMERRANALREEKDKKQKEYDQRMAVEHILNHTYNTDKMLRQFSSQLKAQNETILERLDVQDIKMEDIKTFMLEKMTEQNRRMEAKLDAISHLAFELKDQFEKVKNICTGKNSFSKELNDLESKLNTLTMALL